MLYSDGLRVYLFLAQLAVSSHCLAPLQNQGGADVPIWFSPN